MHHIMDSKSTVPHLCVAIVECHCHLIVFHLRLIHLVRLFSLVCSPADLEPAPSGISVALTVGDEDDVAVALTIDPAATA